MTTQPLVSAILVTPPKSTGRLSASVATEDEMDYPANGCMVAVYAYPQLVNTVIDDFGQV